MSQQQEKLGSGLLLRNFRKQKPNHPDFNANEVELCCPKCREQIKVALAAWEKSGARGKFFSLAISTPYVRPVENEAPKSDELPTGESSETPRNPDDDVPF